MNSIWNKNYNAFTKRFPQLAQMLPAPDITVLSNPSFWELSQAKNGMITCSENGLRLHSAYNPEREAEGGVSNPQVGAKSTTVFYGFGLGYHVVEWARQYNQQPETNKRKLVLIEPDVNHFYAALTILDWTEVFKVEKLILAISCPAESILPLIEDTTKVNIGNSGVSDTYFFQLPTFMAHSQEYFNAVQAIIKRNIRKNEINAATLKKFGKLWCRNSLKNIKKMTELAGVSDLTMTAKNQMPFLIIGAGPSLEKIIPHIKELKKRAIIICVETALRALLRAGVQPDFIIITDPQWWAYRHIAGLKAPESILITEVSSYPAVFRFSCKKILLCGSQFPIGQYYQQKLGAEPGDLGTGGSVASSAWNLAHLWGAKEIFVAGLDFAFPSNQTHIKGSDAEQTYHTISNKMDGADKFTASALFSANAALGNDYNGAPVVTDTRMKMFAWWFESRLAGCPETKTYTLCPEGLNVPGITPVSVEELLNRQDISQAKKKFLSSGEGKPVVSGDKVPAFKKITKEFPNKEFLNQFDFLREYL